MSWHDLIFVKVAGTAPCAVLLRKKHVCLGVSGLNRRGPTELSGRPWRQGFTLLELLVVISMTAVLLTMLLPALRQVRGTTMRISCVNNEKQLGVVTSMYVSDNDDWYPFFWHPSGPAVGSRLGLWARHYTEQYYLDVGRDEAYWPGFDIDLHCPACTPGVNCDANADYVMQALSTNAWDTYGGGFTSAVAGAKWL